MGKCDDDLLRIRHTRHSGQLRMYFWQKSSIQQKAQMLNLEAFQM